MIVPDWEEGYDQRQENPNGVRFLLFRIALVFFFGILLVQLWRLQVVEGSRYRNEANENRLRVRTIDSPRGVMYDRNGGQLVKNVPTFTVAVIPAGLPRERASRERALATLASLVGEPEEQVRRAILPVNAGGERRTDDFTPVPIKKRVSFELVAAIEERQREIPGATVLVQPMREYREGELIAHLSGYASRITAEWGSEHSEWKNNPKLRYGTEDNVGHTGLELSLEPLLRGEPGQQWLEVDSSERPVRTLRVEPPVPGRSVVLTIDMELQKAVADILRPYVEEYLSIAAVVMNPRNGQILAMVDLPSYDVNLFSRGISEEDFAKLLNDPHRPMLNKAVGGTFAPGSIFKVITGGAALQENVIDKNVKLPDIGYIRIPREIGIGFDVLKDWQAHGDQDMIAALATSCDVYFYQLAGGEPEGKWAGLGNERLADYARRFGLGRPTNVGLPGEAAGVVPDASWKRRELKEEWVKGDTYIYGIGQSYLTTTPLQMANVYAAIANGGTLYRPQLVLEVRDHDGKVVEPFAVDPAGKLPVSAEHLETIRNGLLSNFVGPDFGYTPNGAKFVGTAYTARIPELEQRGIRLAGKTGTAESRRDAAGNYETHGWFVAYAPADDPEVVVLVFAERGRGSQEAAERVEDILRHYFKVPPQPRELPTPTPNPGPRTIAADPGGHDHDHDRAAFFGG